MAESTKRQNAGGKAPVATPNVGQPGLVSLENALNGAVGARIRLQTTIPAHPTLEGTLYTICSLTNLLALTTSGASPSHHILPLSALTNFTLLSTTTAPPPPLAPISPSFVQARAANALARAHEKASKVNRTVPKEAQEIFDALSRTLPTRWEGKDFVVMDQIIVKGPGYRAEDCKAGKDAGKDSLGRVRKVLENERKKLAQREQKGPKPVVPVVPAIPAFTGGPRKGG
ncbi:hypothetical protein MMC28_001194 [Mycoblastus sanguinarius]|nr:hypothetical protein [Mycoblastus sanguinarius]